jgi:hypothetical protein
MPPILSRTLNCQIVENQLDKKPVERYTTGLGSSCLRTPHVGIPPFIGRQGNEIIADPSAAGITLQTRSRARHQDEKTQPGLRSIETWPWYLPEDISEHVIP